jgi:hypothetical protein
MDDLSYLVDLFRALTFVGYRHIFVEPNPAAFEDCRRMFREEQLRLQNGLLGDWTALADLFYPTVPTWLAEPTVNVESRTMALHEAAVALAKP